MNMLQLSNHEFKTSLGVYLGTTAVKHNDYSNISGYKGALTGLYIWTAGLVGEVAIPLIRYFAMTNETFPDLWQAKEGLEEILNRRDMPEVLRKAFINREWLVKNNLHIPDKDFIVIGYSLPPDASFLELGNYNP